MMKKNDNFVPYTLNFGKYKGKKFEDVQDEKYINYLNTLKEKTKAVEFFLKWIEMQKNLI